jgi:hypothetical protein
MNILIWIPVVIICYAIQGWMSGHNKNAGEYFWIWLWIIGALPLWAIVSKYSHNILRDMIYFDASMVVGFNLGLIIYGAYSGSNYLQWVGILIVFIGILIFNQGV